MSQIKKETISGAKWGLLQKLTMQPLQLVYGMVLARLITPEEMGILGLTAIFFAIANQLATSGFGAALVRKTDRTEDDCCTMFWFNLSMSFMLGLILFLLAPWFVVFFKQPELLYLTRVSAVLLFLNSSASVHWSLYQARRDFKIPAIINTITAIAGMPVCLTLAWMGWGVWALMWQSIFTALLSLGLVWYLSPWRPSFRISRNSFRYLFGFGSKLAFSGILHVFYQNIRGLIIGKFYTPERLGLYNRGDHLANVVPHTLSGILSSVTYPILASIQQDDNRLCNAYRKYIKAASLIIAFFTFALISMAQPAVELFYGKTWVPCAIFLQIIALAGGVDHICVINLNLLMVKGRSDLFLRLEIIKKSISLLMIFYAATISVEAICWATALYAQVAIFINTYYTGKLLGLTWWVQQKDYMPYFLRAAAACIPAWLCTQADWPVLLQLLTGGSSAFILYFGSLHLRKEPVYVELYHSLQSSKWGKWLPVL